MDNVPVVAANNIPPAALRGARTVSLERAAMLYARFALGAAFLSAVADRFGLWGKYGGWGNFANFTQYTGQVNSFMPAFIIPFLAWAATAAELSLGIALIIGFRLRSVALGTDILPPHATTHGFLFFDLNHDVDAIHNSHLYVPDLAFMTDNKALFFFEIDLADAR